VTTCPPSALRGRRPRRAPAPRSGAAGQGRRRAWLLALRPLLALAAGTLLSCAAKEGEGGFASAFGSAATTASLASATPGGSGAGEAPPGALPLAPWWEALGDPALSREVETALARQPSLREGAARVREARELARGAAAEGLPGAMAEGGYRRGRERDRSTRPRSEKLEPWHGLTEWSWELDLFGRIAARRDESLSRVDERVAEWEGLRLALSAEVAAACLEQRRYAEETRLVESIAAASAGVGKVLGERARAGLASEFEADRQEAETESLRRLAEETGLRRRLAASRTDALAGRPAGSGAALEGGLGDGAAVPALPASMPVSVVGRRPDLRAAEAAVRAAVHGEEAARLELYPSLSLRFDGSLAAGSLSGPAAMWLAGGGPRLSLPLLDPGARASARAARARAEEAVAAWESAFLRALEEVEAASLAMQSARRQLAHAERETARLARVWTNTRRTFEAGVVSQVEVLEDQRRYLAASRERLDLRHRVLVAYLDWIKATGGGGAD